LLAAVAVEVMAYLIQLVDQVAVAQAAIQVTQQLVQLIQVAVAVAFTATILHPLAVLEL
jgi:hypothetical protein